MFSIVARPVDYEACTFRLCKASTMVPCLLGRNGAHAKAIGCHSSLTRTACAQMTAFVRPFLRRDSKLKKRFWRVIIGRRACNRRGHPFRAARSMAIPKGHSPLMFTCQRSFDVTNVSERGSNAATSRHQCVCYGRSCYWVCCFWPREGT